MRSQRMTSPINSSSPANTYYMYDAICVAASFMLDRSGGGGDLDQTRPLLLSHLTKSCRMSYMIKFGYDSYRAT